MNWKEKLENNIVCFAFGLLAIGWGAGVATCRFFPQFAGLSTSRNISKAESPLLAQQSMVLPPIWIPANSGTPILDGRGMITVHDYIIQSNRNESTVEIDVTLPDAKWEGNNPAWVIVGGGHTRYFTWQSNRYVLNVLSVEPNRTQVSIADVSNKE